MIRNVLKLSAVLVLLFTASCKENAISSGMRVKVDLSKLSQSSRSALSIPAVCFFINVRDLQAPRVKTPNTVAADQSADCLGFETVSALIPREQASTTGIPLSMTGSNFDQKIELYGVLGMPCGSSNLLSTANASSQIFLFTTAFAKAQSQEITLTPTEATIDRNDRFSVCRNNNRRTIGGVASGIASTSVDLVLQNNRADNVNVTANGTFSFPTTMAPGENYNVTVFTQPQNQYCAVENGSGVVTATSNVTNITVKCANKNEVLQYLSVTPPSGAVNVNSTLPMVATGYFRDGTSSTLTSSVTWSATPASTVTIDSAGVATVLSTGAFTINASKVNTVGETITGMLAIGSASTPTLTVSNLNSADSAYRLIETGFIKGTSSGISTLGVQYDNGSINTFAATASWTVTLPQGINTWRLGTNHIIKIGAANAAGFIGSPQTFYVRKGNNRDFNGDGYPDIAVSSVARNSVYLFYSRGANGFNTGIATFTTVTSNAADVTLTESSSVIYGYSLAVADFNSDGYADIAIGDPAYSSSKGRVYLYTSSAASATPISSSTTAHSPTDYIGSANSFRFGESLAAGDIDGDGYSDLAVGARGAKKAYLFYRDSSSGYPSLAATLYPSATTRFGVTVAIGNMDGNNFADVVVGDNMFNTVDRERLNTAAGKFFIYYSTSSTGIGNLATESAYKEGTNQYDYLSSSLALGDINGDGRDDLVVGAMGDGSSNGNYAHIYYSTSSGGPNFAGAPTNLTSGVFSDLFGESLATGDLNGDGYADLVVGGTGTNGSAVIFYSVFSGGTASLPTTPAKTIVGTAASDSLGKALAITDVNGDGYSDLLTSACNASANSLSNNGVVSVYHTSSVGLGTTLVVSTLLMGYTSSDFFGVVLK